jgi:hypothetical protein
MALIVSFPMIGQAAVSRTKKSPKTQPDAPELAPPKARILRSAADVQKARPLVDWRKSDFSTQRPAMVPAARPSAQYASLGLQPTAFTPYDRFLDTVWPVLRQLDNSEASMLRVLRLMETGHNFAYRFTDPYRPQSPELTAVKRSGDCKSKALWLCAELGDATALWVVGKKTRNSGDNHAWVYWRNEGRWYILDCTENNQPVAADEMPRDRYIPYYSFGKSGAFRHAATRIELASAAMPARKMAVVAQRSGKDSSSR